MAEKNRYFEAGMIVKCTTCHGETIQGEVSGFDYTLKMLMLSKNLINCHSLSFFAALSERNRLGIKAGRGSYVNVWDIDV